MALGYCALSFRFPENESLKGKRQVLRSVIQRLRSKYNVAVAEVDDQDSWQLATLGISCVSSSGAHCHEMLEKAVSFIGDSRLDAELLDYSIEIIHA